MTKSESKLKEMADKVSHLARTGYLPNPGRSSDALLNRSHFTGPPLLLPGEEHPMCGDCGTNLANVLHLNLSELPVLPPGLPRHGAIQVLKCANRETVKQKRCKGEDWKAFSNTKLCRLLTEEQMMVASTSAATKSFLPAVFIDSWAAIAHLYPHPTEPSVQEMKLNDADLKTYEKLRTKDYVHLDPKYLGWPHFFREASYEACPKCGEKMSFLFQLASEYPFSWLTFGNEARPMVQYCPNHPEMITYAWSDKNTSKAAVTAGAPEKGSVLHQCRSLARTTYVPQIDRVRVLPETSCRIGGMSLLYANESQPTCGACGSRLAILLQLNLSMLPDRPEWLPKTGILQIFKCANPEDTVATSCRGEDFRGFAKTKLCRMIPEERFGELRVSEDSEEVQARWIASWDRIDFDYPHPEEDVVEDLELSDKKMERYVEDTLSLPQAFQHKYLGWPAFCQGIEYETCPLCNTTMEFIFQLHSDDESQLLWFGDEGVCVVQACPKHPDVITYNWACS